MPVSAYTDGTNTSVSGAKLDNFAEISKFFLYFVTFFLIMSTNN